MLAFPALTFDCSNRQIYLAYNGHYLPLPKVLPLKSAEAAELKRSFENICRLFHSSLPANLLQADLELLKILQRFLQQPVKEEDIVEHLRKRLEDDVLWKYSISEHCRRVGINRDFAPYVKAGKSVKIVYTGSADATPINGKLAYNGEYGDIKDQAVVVNGKPSKLTVTKASGITSNEQLSLVRAISVKDFTYKNIPALKNMKTTDNFVIEVSPNKGSEYRRVTVEFLFENAF